ncbi:hypothetical protein Bbelb_289940 [Branchiostoma belcheri]|nr:hypothetical protein Bbelb_289940 [Branchiostoma belcheri]
MATVLGAQYRMYGAQYRIGTNVPFGSTYLNAHDVPCAVCYVPTRGKYVCVDGNPETVQGGQADQLAARFWPVEARCGSLPCPNHVEGREFTCVVCTKCSKKV